MNQETNLDPDIIAKTKLISPVFPKASKSVVQELRAGCPRDRYPHLENWLARLETFNIEYDVFKGIDTPKKPVNCNPWDPRC